MKGIAHITVAVAAVLLSACSRPSQLPEVGVSTAAIAIEAPATGEPAPQTIYVVNTGRGSLPAPVAEIAYLDGAGWLAAEVTGGGAPYAVALSAKTAGLQPGAYRATLTLACGDASGSPVQVPVTLTVPDPRYALSTAEVVISATQRADPPVATFGVTNGGRGVLPVPRVEVDYVGTTSGWLDAPRVLGAAGAYSVELVARAAGLDSGVYQAVLRVGAADGSGGPPRTLSVKLVVGPSAISVSSRGLALTLARVDAEGWSASGTLTVTNVGAGVLGPPTIAVPTPGPFSATVTGTQEPYVLTVNARVPRETLEAGTYRAELYLSAPDASNVETISVTTLVERPVMRPSSPSVSWSQYAGCPAPGPRAITVTNDGPGKLARPTATVSGAAASWLEASVTGEAPPYGVRLAVKALPEVDAAKGASLDGSVSLDAPGAVPVVVPVRVTLTPSTAVTSTLSRSALTIAAQAGLGDPGPVTLSVNTAGGCVAPPAVGVTYASGDPAWLSTRITTKPQRHDVVVRGQLAGMSAGDTRTATLRIAAPDLAADVPVSLSVGALRATGSLTQAASASGEVVALRDGGALVIGGTDPLAITSPAPVSTAERYDPATGQFTAYPSLNRPRSGHKAIVLDSGTVLVCGGDRTTDRPEDTCEVSSGGAWSLLGPVPSGGKPAGLAALPGDRALVVFGSGLPAMILDASTGTWTSLPATRTFSSAVTLADGRILALTPGSRAAWLYDPALDLWTQTGSTASGDADGLVALAGGGALLIPYAIVGAAELWDPTTGLWGPSGQRPWATTGETSWSTHFRSRDLVALSNGLVVGFCGVAGTENVSDIQVFDSVAKTWSSAGKLPAGELRRDARPVQLRDGLVLLVGGWRCYYSSGPFCSPWLQTPGVLAW